MSQPAQPRKELPKAPARLGFHQSQQCIDHGPVAFPARDRPPIPRRPRKPNQATSSIDRDLVVLHHNLRNLAFRRRLYSFRFSTSLIAAFSSASSAYILFNLAFSASRSFIRLSSLTVTPLYFDRQLKYVALLIPCFLATSPTATPASPSFKIATICDSVNLDFFM